MPGFPFEAEDGDAPGSPVDSAARPSTSTSLALNKGRTAGSPDYKFNDRLYIIKYLVDQKYLIREPSGTLKQDHTKPRLVPVPLMKGSRIWQNMAE